MCFTDFSFLIFKQIVCISYLQLVFAHVAPCSVHPAPDIVSCSGLPPASEYVIVPPRMSEQQQKENLVSSYVKFHLEYNKESSTMCF